MHPFQVVHTIKRPPGDRSAAAAALGIVLYLNNEYAFFIAGAPVLISTPEHIPIHIAGIYILSLAKAAGHERHIRVADDYRSCRNSLIVLLIGDIQFRQ